MKNNRTSQSWLFTLLICVLGCNHQSPDSITVFAAASLVAPMQEIAARFDSLHAGNTTRLNFAASSFLARQIEEQAPADVCISASPEWTTYLAQRGLADSTATFVIARNLLVVISDPSLPAPPSELHDLLHEVYWPIAVGDPTHVPLGRYAQEALTRAALWDSLSAHLLPAMDADAAVATVERGEAPAGIAYQNEAVDNPHVRLAFVFPDVFQPEIVYTAAVVSSTGNQKMAEAFLDFLNSADGQAILREHHFIPVAYE